MCNVKKRIKSCIYIKDTPIGMCVLELDTKLTLRSVDWAVVKLRVTGADEVW